MTAVAMTKDLFHQSVSQGDKPVLVEYWAPWCVYCRRITPAMNKVAEQFSDALVVGQVNIDDEPQLVAQEQIEVIPTLVLYQNGQALGSIVAPESKAAIETFIQETLSK